MGAWNSLVLGQVGGQTEHSHQIASGQKTSATTFTLGASDSNFLVSPGPGPEMAQKNHTHSVPAHNHELGALDTDTQFNLPPYVSLFKLMRVR